MSIYSLLSVEVPVVESVRSSGSKRVQHMFPFPSKTDQSFKSDCDINLVVKRFMKVNNLSPRAFMDYMLKTSSIDTSGVIREGTKVDYQEHLKATLEADQMFAALPSDLRKRFSNSPAQFLDFVYKPENRAELASMGLLNQEATQRIKAAQAASNAVSNPVSGTVDQLST